MAVVWGAYDTYTDIFRYKRVYLDGLTQSCDI